MSHWSDWAQSCLVTPGRHVHLDTDFDSAATPPHATKAESDELLASAIAELFDLQARFTAEATRAIVVVLQATDAAGKDGTIKHVMTGLDPEGVNVHSFKTPSSTERMHDFLWRHQLCLPELGSMAIFNRSHYENVLVTRVHPDYLWPAAAREADPGTLWKRRYRAINEWERHLSDEGTIVIKLFLNLSKAEQERRFLSRIDDPDKNWKFSAADLEERPYWDDYRTAFEEMLNHTSTDVAPWYVIPADHKWASHLFTSAVLIDAIAALRPEFPIVDDATRAGLQKAKAELLAADAGPEA